MKSYLWNLLTQKKFSAKTKNKLFLIAMITFYGIIGYLVWLFLGQRLLGNHIDWLICFIYYPAAILGFFQGILYIYNHEGQ